MCLIKIHLNQFVYKLLILFDNLNFHFYLHHKKAMFHLLEIENFHNINLPPIPLKGEYIALAQKIQNFNKYTFLEIKR